MQKKISYIYILALQIVPKKVNFFKIIHFPQFSHWLYSMVSSPHDYWLYIISTEYITALGSLIKSI